MTLPPEVTQTVELLERCFGDELLAVYLHGSAVSGGLRPNSDLDLLGVIARPMSADVRERLLADLLQISGRHPTRPGYPRPIELIVFRMADLSEPAYPARSEFVYGEWLRNAFETGEGTRSISDPEFTLILAQARKEAKSLVGPPAADLLPEVAPADVRRAIGDALPALIDGLQGDERNVILTLARMWRTLSIGDFVSKDVAAEWAAARLPVDSASVLAGARAAYLATCSKDCHEQEVHIVAKDLTERVTALL